MFHKIFFILLIAETINLALSSRSKSLPEDATTSNNVRNFDDLQKKDCTPFLYLNIFFVQDLQRNRKAMKNMYNALKNMLPPAIKRSNKEIDEEDNQEYWMRLKKNLPKIQTSFPSVIIKRIIQFQKRIDYMRLRKIKRSTLPIEVSQDFFDDDDDFDGPTAFLSLYGAGGDFDLRLLKQMNFADPDNTGKGWKYYMRL